MKRLTLTATEKDQRERLDRFIATHSDLSRGAARRAIADGSVYVDGKRTKVSSRGLWPGQVVEVVLEEAGRAGPEPATALPILYEDQDLLAVDKPSGVPSQATQVTDRGTAAAFAEGHVGRPAGLVHRLDRETSGVLLFGKSAEATAALAEAFRKGSMRKRYLCAVVGNPPAEALIDSWLYRDPAHPGRFLAGPPGRGVPALTRVRTLGRSGQVAAVEASPETGRTHQIRAHLASVGCPILGDRLYGGSRGAPVEGGVAHGPRVMLHAASLRLAHPSGGAPLEIVAEPPEDLRAVLAFCLKGKSGFAKP